VRENTAKFLLQYLASLKSQRIFCSFPRGAWEREKTCWSRGFSRWAGRDDL